jgi:DNA-binding phage protein
MENNMEWLIRKYMAHEHIKSMTELATLTGIKRQHLYKLISEPSRMRLFEIMALDEALKFSEADLVALVRGEV